MLDFPCGCIVGVKIQQSSVDLSQVACTLDVTLLVARDVLECYVFKLSGQAKNVHLLPIRSANARWAFEPNNSYSGEQADNTAAPLGAK